MPQYTVTDEEAQIIRELEEFRSAIKHWFNPSRTDDREQLRSLINRRLEDVAEIVRLAGCRQTITISPPPAIGGYVMHNVDPFAHIFQEFWGISLNSKVFDMLDQTIGVIESGKFQNRKERLQKAKGSMGPISGKKVFLVHGHDESAREGVERFLEKLGLDAIILHEQPNAGRTIIEKVEKFAEVAFAVVLLTPDDVGGTAVNPQALSPRARQNVILELGYFLGKLGRTHVAALLKGDVEKPSDYDGVVYIVLDGRGLLCQYG
jgi:predicted nucleotide-binding protein